LVKCDFERVVSNVGSNPIFSTIKLNFNLKFKIMFKFVIYKSNTLQIVKLTNEEPHFSTIEEDEDFDLVRNWKQIAKHSKAIDDYVALNSH
jgi:hypothetical protein